MVLNVGTGRGTSLVDLHALMVEVAGRVVVELGEVGPRPSGSSNAPDPVDPTGGEEVDGGAREGGSGASRTAGRWRRFARPGRAGCRRLGRAG